MEIIPLIHSHYWKIEENQSQVYLKVQKNQGVQKVQDFPLQKRIVIQLIMKIRKKNQVLYLIDKRMDQEVKVKFLVVGNLILIDKILMKKEVEVKEIWMEIKFKIIHIKVKVV